MDACSASVVSACVSSRWCVPAALAASTPNELTATLRTAAASLLDPCIRAPELLRNALLWSPPNDSSLLRLCHAHQYA